MILLLALVDLLCAVALGLLLLGYPLWQLQAGAALLLLMKGVAFFADILSVFDVAAAVCMIVLLWIAAPNLALAILVYLVVKALYSLA